MIRLGRVARNLQWGVAGVWGPSSQRSKILYFFAKIINFGPILIKINAFEMWHKNLQCKT